MTRETLLADLVVANGAVLYWQLPKPDVLAAVDNDDVRLDGDLIVHRDAFRIGDGAYSMRRDDCVTAIAEAFAEVIRQWLTADELAEVKRRNAHYDDKVCATHDFCDANMAMAEAFEHVTGRHPLATAEDEAAQALWNDAWGLAKRLYFT